MAKTKTQETNSADSKAPPADDYVARAIKYAEAAIADTKRKKFGKWIRLAAKRFLADLKRAEQKAPPFYFSAERANHACAWIEQLPHVEGTWNSETIVLEDFQVFLIVQLFGFRNADGTRRFTTVLFAIARKNAKSTLAAAILLYVFCEEPEQGPQIYSAATTGAQARIVWGVAKRMVEKTSDLRDAYQVEPFANAIARYENGGTFKPINAKASTQDGLNPSALCLDELHAHKTHDLLNVLTSAAGARGNPLFIYATTEGYENPGPWAEQRNFAQQVLEGIVEADHYLAIYYAVDEEDGDFDAGVVIKANPLAAANPILSDAIRKEAIEAKAMPGKLAEFRIKRLNRRAASASAWVNIPKWLKCAGDVPLDKLRGAPCWGAFDLASTTDMNAWRLLWLLEGRWYTWGRYWVPEEAVKQRTERRTVPYQGWVDAGHITLTSGDVTDYEVIQRDILEDWKRFAPKKVCYDPWNATQLANALVAEGLPIEQFIQGGKSYNNAMNECERAYISGNLSTAGDPVLTWNMANLVPRTDANLNKAPDRKRSADKIDGACCLFMCFGLAVAEQEAPKQFQAFFV